jgi:hypothetical protein
MAGALRRVISRIERDDNCRAELSELMEIHQIADFPFERESPPWDRGRD